MTSIVDIYMAMLGFLDAHSVQIIAALQATFCGGISYQIAMKYSRGKSQYHWMPSLCAFALASLMGQQWLSIVLRVLFTGVWPVVSTQNTMAFAILFALLVRAEGNVSRMFDFGEHDKRVAS